MEAVFTSRKNCKSVISGNWKYSHKFKSYTLLHIFQNHQVFPLSILAAGPYIYLDLVSRAYPDYNSNFYFDFSHLEPFSCLTLYHKLPVKNSSSQAHL